MSALGGFRLRKPLARTPHPRPWGERSRQYEPVLHPGAQRYICHLKQHTDRIEATLSPSRINLDLPARHGLAMTSVEAIASACGRPYLFLPSDEDEQQLCIATLRRRPIVVDIEDRALRLLGFVGA